MEAMLFVNFFEAITIGVFRLFRVTGRASARGDRLFSLGACAKAKSGGQNRHDQYRF
jgi:hypothetical protein